MSRTHLNICDELIIKVDHAEVRVPTFFRRVNSDVDVSCTLSVMTGKDRIKVHCAMDRGRLPAAQKTIDFVRVDAYRICLPNVHLRSVHWLTCVDIKYLESKAQVYSRLPCTNVLALNLLPVMPVWSIYVCWCEDTGGVLITRFRPAEVE